MKWGRGYVADGSEIIGVIDDQEFHPRVGLGSEISTGASVPISEVTLIAPVRPGKFIGLWNNYKAAAEKGGMEHPSHPLYFFKGDSSLSGHNADVELPLAAGRVVFEGELGIVIGKICKEVTAEEADEAIFGYTCVNDITSLGILHAEPSFPQWTRAKSFDGFGVVGPIIETSLNWKELTVKTLVNGRERQSYLTSDMILSPAEIISCLSQDMTLNPGDLIACGTSLGARPIKPGMAVEVVIKEIGSVSVTMKAPSANE